MQIGTCQVCTGQIGTAQVTTGVGAANRRRGGSSNAMRPRLLADTIQHIGAWASGGFIIAISNRAAGHWNSRKRPSDWQ
jgi:hypothetical protein